MTGETMKTLDEIKSVLAQHKEELTERYKVKEMGIFGSAVRGEQGKTSDIDILVDFKEDADLFDLAGLGLFLEEKFNQRVDIVSKGTVKANRWRDIEKNLIYV